MIERQLHSKEVMAPLLLTVLHQSIGDGLGRSTRVQIGA
jgi:hypothetical protein